MIPAPTDQILITCHVFARDYEQTISKSIHAAMVIPPLFQIAKDCKFS